MRIFQRQLIDERIAVARAAGKFIRESLGDGIMTKLQGMPYAFRSSMPRISNAASRWSCAGYQAECTISGFSMACRRRGVALFIGRWFCLSLVGWHSVKRSLTHTLPPSQYDPKATLAHFRCAAIMEIATRACLSLGFAQPRHSSS